MTTIPQKQKELIEEINDLETWWDRYDFIIQMGKELKPFPEDQKNEENKVSGCVSKVWLISNGNTQEVTFHSDSDSFFVKGLVALLLEVYSGQSAQEILDHPPYFLKETEVVENLSPNRANGVGSMVEHIRMHARKYLN